MEFYSDNFQNIARLCTEEMNLSKSEHKLEALLMRGTYYYLSCQYDLGKKDFQTILASKNVDSKFVVNACIKLALLEAQISEDFTVLKYFRTETTISDFRKSISLDVNLPIPRVLHSYAEILAYVGPYTVDDVQDVFEDLLHKFSFSADAHLFYGKCLVKFGEASLSCELLDKAISLEPKNAMLLTHKAILLLEGYRDPKACCNVLDKAIEKDKNCTYSLERLAYIELARGNTLRAMEVIKQAIDTSNNIAEMTSLYHLLVYAELELAKEGQA